jgi:hypothetical protein
VCLAGRRSGNGGPSSSGRPVEKLEGRLLDALDTYLELMDNQAAPDQARLAAADRIIERLIGKVGERLTVHKERAEVTVRYDVERLGGDRPAARGVGAIEGEVVHAEDNG